MRCPIRFTVTPLDFAESDCAPPEAQWFAEGSEGFGLRDAVVFSRDVLTYTNGRKEQEFVIFPPSLKKISRVKSARTFRLDVECAPPRLRRRRRTLPVALSRSRAVSASIPEGWGGGAGTRGSEITYAIGGADTAAATSATGAARSSRMPERAGQR